MSLDIAKLLQTFTPARAIVPAGVVICSHWHHSKNLAWNLLKAFPKATYHGPFNNHDEAVEAAIDVACAVGEIGIDAGVLMQEHQLKREWTYSQDFNTIMR